ncbi:MAG: glycoside hydrolase family 26 protein [Clostridium sp.]|nr:glycoside hydrolase family 26 protein [Clostridium sp.]
MGKGGGTVGIFEEMFTKNLSRKLKYGILLVLLTGILSGYARAPQSVYAASLSAAFNPGSKWDWMGDNFNLDVTTSDVPREGIMFTADLLIQSSVKPQFQGRMNVEVILLIGDKQRWTKCETSAQIRAINFTQSITENGAVWYKSKVVVPISGIADTDINGVWTKGIPYGQAINQSVTGVKVFIAGTQCDYKGIVRLENPKLEYTADMSDGVSVETTVPRQDLTVVSIRGEVLAFEDGSLQTFPRVTLTDTKASAATVDTAKYLAALGKTNHVVFGHQNSPCSKAGTVKTPLNGLTNSDIEDITGSPAGVIGFDGLSLVGEEFNSTSWNKQFAQQGMEAINIDALGEPAANVKALANLSNYCLSQGSMITLSCHMPNFSQVKLRAGYQKNKEPSYARYDFSTSTARDKSGSPMDILQGGSYNAQFLAYLDMIADYASQVNGTILFRPFHEGTGTWFWWGTSTCDAETYQKVFRYTVEYLRDQKQVHNLLYVYSPAANPELAEILARYPGDAYVDIIGYDNYCQIDLVDSDEWFSDFSDKLSKLGKFAAQHDKLLAVTETGINMATPALGDFVTGLPRKDCPDLQWFEKLLDIVSDSDACYVLIWSNGSEMFHAPFVRAVNSNGSLYGHELLDDFLRFYNDKRSVFASNQAKIVQNFG